MALYLGHVLLSGELLNRMAVPLLLGRYRFLNDLSFEVAGRTVTARLAGRYARIGFRGSIAARLLPFGGPAPACRTEWQLTFDLRPRLLNPLLAALLGKQVSGRPGMAWGDGRLSLKLNELPFMRTAREMLGGAMFLAALPADPDPDGPGRGLRFDLYLHSPDPPGGDRAGETDPPTA